MLYHHKISLAVLCVAFLATAASAQKELEGDRVDVVKDFDVRLLESNKINVTPGLPPLDTSTKKQTYVVPPRPLNVTYAAPVLRPIGMRAGPKEKQYHGFAKLGGGVPASLWGEAGYGFSAGEKFDGKVWFRHHSLNASKNNDNQRFANNDLLANGNLYLKNNVAVEGKVGYSADRVHFYGYNHDSLTLDAERVRQNYNVLDVGGRVYNSDRTELDLNYSVAPKFYVLWDYYSNKETGFDLNMHVTKWFAEKHPLRIGIRTDLTSFEDTATQKLNNIYLQPSFTFHSDFVKFKVGGNFASNRDVFSIFPDAELTLRVWGDGIQIFAGANGDLRKNTFRSISEYNPFINMRDPVTRKLRNTRYDNYFGGIKGNLGFIEYSFQGGYSKASDLALYQPQFTSDGITRFALVYDTVKIVNLQGSGKLNIIKNLSISGTLSSSVFTPNRERIAWGIPQLEGNFNAIYSMLEGKAQVRSGLYIADKIPYTDEKFNDDSSATLIDLNVGGSYYFSKNIGAFLDINNLLNNKRERWHNYPQVGLNFMAGLTARF
ncbi:MAG: hypothetical protein IT269_11160 [Saprospiraceae bacterium]|nr:hypothetical protein [Saprospiraceae bacterium]